MFRLIFLTFYGEPRDKHLYDHAKEEKLTWNRNTPLLFLSLFTLGLFFSGSFTGQGIVKVFPETKYERFQTLIHKPKLEDYGHYSKEIFTTTDTRQERSWTASKYDPTHGLSEAEAHHAHVVHIWGAILSILIAFGGIFFAYRMYYTRATTPEWWTGKFKSYYQTLKEKYYFDHFYIKVLIQKMLLPFNKLLAFLDMGIYDRFVVDGWEAVCRWGYKLSRWFDDLWVDTVMVDGSGASVRFFNVILRTLQSGKLQFYIIMIILVLGGYIWTLGL